jgi:hypothetical protein
MIGAGFRGMVRKPAPDRLLALRSRAAAPSGEAVMRVPPRAGAYRPMSRDKSGHPLSDRHLSELTRHSTSLSRCG